MIRAMAAAQNDAEGLENDRTWVKVTVRRASEGPFRRYPDAWVQLEYGTIHTNGDHECKIATRLYFNDGTHSTEVHV